MAESPERYVGCCGAYCRTCPALADATCRGCKLGYGEGKRDIEKARCKIKKCCFGERKLETCADCDKYLRCGIIRKFQNKKGYKYKKYKQALDFIRKHGYKKFLEKTKNWKGPYGRLE